MMINKNIDKLAAALTEVFNSTLNDTQKVATKNQVNIYADFEKRINNKIDNTISKIESITKKLEDINNNLPS